MSEKNKKENETVLDVFTEFMTLNYKKGKWSHEDNLLDTQLDSFTISRFFDKGVKIIFLNSGTSIFIDKNWLDIFISLNTFAGYKIKSMSDDIDKEDELSSFISKFCEFQHLLYTNNKLAIDKFSEICLIGTEEMRKLVSSKFNINLPTIEYYSIKGNFEI